MPNTFFIFIFGFLLNFSSSLLWSGLPIFLSSKFYDVYWYASLATILTSICGISLVHRLGTKSIFNSALVLISLCLIFLQFNPNLIFTIFFIFLSFGLLQIIEINWIQKITESNKTFLTKRFQWVAAAKLIGMGSGPLFFHYLGTSIITLITFLFLGCLSIPKIQSELFTQRISQNTPDVRFSTFFKNLFPWSIALALLCGILSVSFNPFCLNILTNYQLPTPWFSLYWVSTGIAYLIASSIFHKLDKINYIGYVLTTIQIIVLLVIFMLNKPEYLIISASLYTLLNPYFYLKLSYRATQSSTPYSLATFNLWVDLGIIFGLTISGFISLKGIFNLFLIALVLRGAMLYSEKLPKLSALSFKKNKKTELSSL